MAAVIGEVSRIPAIGIHHINVRISISIRGEGNLSPVRRPCGVYFVGDSVLCQVSLPPTVNIHNIYHSDFYVVHKL